jgi:hypothetical protein
MTKEQTTHIGEENIFTTPTTKGPLTVGPSISIAKPAVQSNPFIIDGGLIVDPKGDQPMSFDDMVKTLNIQEKMARITAEMGWVKKNLKVELSKTRAYQAVSEGDILSAVKPLEEKYRVYSYPAKRSIIDTNVLTTVANYEGGASKETTQLFLRMETVYRFVNVDDPNDWIEQTSYGDGVDSQDKAVGKAMTYSDKYALMKAYKIETGDDPDQEGSAELKGVGKKPVDPKPEVKPEPKPEPTVSATEAQIVELTMVCTEEEIGKIYKHYGIEKLEQLNEKQAQAMLNKKAKDAGTPSGT